jgi:hypothetical protein
LERLRGVLRHADPPVIMPVEAEEEAARLLVIVCVWTFESTCLSVIKNIVSVSLSYVLLLQWYYTLLSIMCV